MPPNPDAIVQQVCSEPFDAFIRSVLAVCTFSGVEANTELPRARIELMKTGLISNEEANHQSLRWCSTLTSSTGGIAPGDGQIILNQNLSDDPFALASTLGHELFHLRQQRTMGEAKFRCEYSKELLAGKGQGRGNWIEREAYEFEDQLRNALLSQWNNVGSPGTGTSPQIPVIANSEYNVHYVKRGDTLWALSEQHLGKGSRFSEIVSFNPDTIFDPDLIFFGDVLRMPTIKPITTD